MRTRYVVIGSLLMAVPSLAIAGDSSVAPQQATVQTKQKSDQKICVDIPDTGTRLSTQRVCGTKAEWEAEHQNWDRTTRVQLDRCATPGTNIYARKTC